MNIFGSYKTTDNHNTEPVKLLVKVYSEKQIINTKENIYGNRRVERYETRVGIYHALPKALFVTHQLIYTHFALHYGSKMALKGFRITR
jgi:hypothetical protein